MVVPESIANMNAAAPRGLSLTNPNPPNPRTPISAVSRRIYFRSNRSQDHPTNGAPSRATNCDEPVNAAAREYACRHPYNQHRIRARYLFDFLHWSVRVNGTQSLLNKVMTYDRGDEQRHDYAVRPGNQSSYICQRNPWI